MSLELAATGLRQLIEARYRYQPEAKRCRIGRVANMNLLLDRCSKRSTLVKELYEDWRLDHEEATFAADVEAAPVLKSALDLCRLCKQTQARLVE